MGLFIPTRGGHLGLLYHCLKIHPYFSVVSGVSWDTLSQETARDFFSRETELRATDSGPTYRVAQIKSAASFPTIKSTKAQGGQAPCRRKIQKLEERRHQLLIHSDRVWLQRILCERWAGSGMVVSSCSWGKPPRPLYWENCHSLLALPSLLPSTVLREKSPTTPTKN